MDRSPSFSQDFVYRMLHDLQGPLRRVGGFSQILKGEAGLSEEGKKHVGFIEKEAKKAQVVLEGVSEYFLALSGDFPAETCNVGDILGEACQDLGLLVEMRKTKIDVQGTPGSIKGMPLLLKMMFRHLLKNAILFSPEGSSVFITFDQRAEGLHMSIQDQGGGIPAGKEEEVFQPFTRLVSYDQVPGAGLGLSLCQEVFKRHGGALSLSSSEKGCVAALNFSK